MEKSIKLVQNIKVELECNPIIPVLGIYPKEFMLIIALFTIAKK